MHRGRGWSETKITYPWQSPFTVVLQAINVNLTAIYYTHSATDSKLSWIWINVLLYGYSLNPEQNAFVFVNTSGKLSGISFKNSVSVMIAQVAGKY